MQQAAVVQGSEIMGRVQNYWTARSDSYSKQNLEEMNNWQREAWRRQILDYAPDKQKRECRGLWSGRSVLSAERRSVIIRGRII